MELDADSIREFIDVWKKEFGEELTFERGKIEAESFFSLFVPVHDIHERPPQPGKASKA